MATEYLVEGVNSLAAGNWRLGDTTTVGSGFVNAATLVINSGSTAITSDLNWSSLTNGVQYLKIAEKFGGNIGTGTSPLIVDASDSTAAVEWSSAAPTEARIEHQGTGTLYLQGDNYGIDNLMQDGAGGTVLVSGTAAYLRVQRGKFQAETAAVVTNAALIDGTATFGTKTTAGTLLNVWGGSHTIQRPFTTINVYGGVVTINAVGAGAASTINQYGGTVILIAHSNTAITAYNHFGGTFDPRGLKFDTIITTYTRSFGATFSGRPNGAALTLTNSYQKDPNIGPV
jgi:hypothetical protein